eukprot:Tbor_TRINITY_DN6205_c1_g1::TRINITY_DN6205_c1_g1_i1::g.1843::m.1843
MTTQCTILGAGTVGLGEYAISVDREVQRVALKDFWSNWERTRKEWNKLDYDRNQKVADALSVEARQKVRAASEQRMQEIRNMIKCRKKYEIEIAEQRKAEQERQRHLNQLLNTEIRRQREEGILHRCEMKRRELEEIQQKRKAFQDADRIEREKRAADVKADRDTLHQYYDYCRKTMLADKEKRLKSRFIDNMNLNEQKKNRKDEVTSWRSDIIRCKSTKIKEMRNSTYIGIEKAKEECLARSKRNFREVKEDTMKQKAIQREREQKYYEENKKTVAELRNRQMRSTEGLNCLSPL